MKDGRKTDACKTFYWAYLNESECLLGYELYSVSCRQKVHRYAKISRKQDKFTVCTQLRFN